MISACYINLSDAADRRRWMESQSRDLAVPMTRIEACDKRLLTPSEIAAHSSASEDVVTSGAVACFLSHRLAWEFAARAPTPFTAVFEDDIHLSPDIGVYLASDDWLPADADIVRLEFFRRRFRGIAAHYKLRGRRRLHRLLGEEAGTGGYIVSRAQAARLLEDVARIGMDVDQVIFGGFTPVSKASTIYAIVPALCVQDRKAKTFSRSRHGFKASIERPKSPAQPKAPAARRGLRKVLDWPAQAEAGISIGMQLNREVLIFSSFR